MTDKPLTTTKPRIGRDVAMPMFKPAPIPKKSPKRMAAVLEAFAEGATVAKAGKAGGVSRITVYKWRTEDTAFDMACREAIEIGHDKLEDEAIRRARDGVDKPVFHQGEIVGEVREYSDTLMQMMLRGARPEKYKQVVAQELTGKDGGPIRTLNGNVALTMDDLKKLSEDELAKQYREAVAPVEGTGE